MAEGINVRFSGALKAFVDQRAAENGVYGSVSEYIRDLVRRDYERDEERRWDTLYGELAPGMSASDSEFKPLDAAEIIGAAKRRSGR